MTVENFRSAIGSAPTGDQQKLREAARLMEAFNLHPSEFFRLSETAMETYIKEYRAGIPAGEKVPALMETPEALVRGLLYAYPRFRDCWLGHDLPYREPPKSRQLEALLEEKRPEKLKRDVSRWRPRKEGELPGVGMGKPLTQKVIARIVTILWQYCAILATCELDLNDDVTFEAVTDPEVQQLVYRRLPQHYAKKTIPSFIGALHRISKDLLGQDHANTVSFATARRNNKDTQTLSAAIIQDCRDLNGSGALDPSIVTIWEMPDLMRERSEMAGLRPHDRDARKGHAIVVDIAMEVTSLPISSIDRINFDEDIVVDGGVRKLKFINKIGEEDTSPLTPKLWQSIDELMQFRESFDLQSPWLFSSGYDTKKRSKQCAATLVATAMEAVLRTRMARTRVQGPSCQKAPMRKRVTLTRVQDAVIVNAIDTGKIDPVEISAQHGHKFAKSFRERYKVALRSPLYNEKVKKKNDGK